MRPARGHRVRRSTGAGRRGDLLAARIRRGRRVDRVAGRTVDGVTYVQLGRADVDDLAAAIDGCSALIHLAAIPAPYRPPAPGGVRQQHQATFAALQAAADAGITRAVIASSGSAYGTALSPEPSHPRYVPVDEDHPMNNADPYGLSKEVDERTAEMFTRRYPMSVAALRFHWIAAPRGAARSHRRSSAAATRTSTELLRGLWGYVDLRDAARACRLAVEAAARQPVRIRADEHRGRRHPGRDAAPAELLERHAARHRGPP